MRSSHSPPRAQAFYLCSDRSIIIDTHMSCQLQDLDAYWMSFKLGPRVPVHAYKRVTWASHSRSSPFLPSPHPHFFPQVSPPIGPSTHIRARTLHAFINGSTLGGVCLPWTHRREYGSTANIRSVFYLFIKSVKKKKNKQPCVPLFSNYFFAPDVH